MADPTPTDHAAFVQGATPSILATLREKLAIGGEAGDYCAAVVSKDYPGLPAEYESWLVGGRGVFLEPRQVIATIVGSIDAARHAPILTRLAEPPPPRHVYVLVFEPPAASIHLLRLS